MVLSWEIALAGNVDAHSNLEIAVWEENWPFLRQNVDAEERTVHQVGRASLEQIHPHLTDDKTEAQM